MSELSKSELGNSRVADRPPVLAIISNQSDPVTARRWPAKHARKQVHTEHDELVSEPRTAIAGGQMALPALRTVSSRHGPRMAVKSQGSILLLDLQDVAVVRAQGNYVILQQKTDSYFLRESISVLAEKLKPYGFIRIHRSVLVNRAYVDEIRSRENGLCVGARQYTVTRTYKQELNHLAELWIGVDRFASKP